MFMDYLYDGSFEGLLTSIYLHYYEEKAEGIYPETNYQYSLMSPSRIVHTDSLLAAKVYDAIERKISHDSLRSVFYVYLSSHPCKENLILKYLLLGFKLGYKIEGYHTHPDILPVIETARKVSFEAHRFLGLLRFAESDNFLYAAFEPDHNILMLIADHFAERLQRENFIIHDRKRDLAVVYNQKDWILSDFHLHKDILFSNSETYFQTLWTEYFTHIGIDSRKNKKLQAHFVPQRYRRNLIEFRMSYHS
ncbi:MAG: DNA metabolism protein [Peptococcaceae bacterium]|nr:DNA metabolism protein [Peptococcaceae bacterium]